MIRQILSKCVVVSLTAAASRKRLWLVDSIIIMAIVLCQIRMQAVEYILDDQTINSEQVCGSNVNLH